MQLNLGKKLKKERGGSKFNLVENINLYLFFYLDEEPEMDIFINNVVCSFSVRCHLNLKEIALSGSNVEYR